MEQYKTDAEIYAVLEREIIDLTIRPGSSLSENPLCARFGAPRTLIRVVLQKLQENGLVKIVPYKGTTVTRLNRRIVDELIYERTAVEGRILRDFAPNATPAQRAQIRARVDAYEALARAENPDFNKLYEMDCRLHETWFAAMDKMYLWSTLQNAHGRYLAGQCFSVQFSVIRTEYQHTVSFSCIPFNLFFIFIKIISQHEFRCSKYMHFLFVCDTTVFGCGCKWSYRLSLFSCSFFKIFF